MSGQRDGIIIFSAETANRDRVNMADSLVVPAITAVGIVIAMGQFLLARQRLRLDLYDRRYKVFESARRLIIEILREGFAERSAAGRAVARPTCCGTRARRIKIALPSCDLESHSPVGGNPPFNVHTT